MSAEKSKSKAAFHHSRLSSPRSIRVLTLIPSLELQDPLEVILKEVSLDDVSDVKNSYEALSYVWGARTGTEPIQCDGKQLLVTPNCESALQHLRLKDKARIVWIDAICIDQEYNSLSTKERNVQVAFMGEIYQKAVLTLCWFGEGNDYTDELMAHLNQIGNCPSQRGLKKFLLFDGMYKHLEAPALTYIVTEKLREEGRINFDSSALNHILSHPWHSRIWTVQEAAYSQDCHVLCGNSTIPWDNYSTAAKYLVLEEYIDGLDEQAHRGVISIDMRNGIRDYLRKVESSKSKANPGLEDDEDERDQTVVFLTSYLTDVNQLQAINPRDRIYGLHALYTDLGIPLLAVDYEKPISQVYEEAAVAMISWSGTLKVLGNACHSHRNSSFPSWVPDWSDESLKIFTPFGNATAGSKIAQSTPEIVNPDHGELRVRGKTIGIVLAWRKNRSISAIFPTHLEQCDLPILIEKLDGLIEDDENLEVVRLAIGRTRFFRQCYTLLRTSPDLYDGDSEEMFIDFLNQSSYSEPDKTFEIWLDILNYPDTKYDFTLGEILVEKWKIAEESTATRWTPELTACAVIVISLVSNLIRYDGRPLNNTSEILDQVNEFSMRLADKTLILAHLNCPRRDFATDDILPSKAAVLGTVFHSAVAGDSVVLLEGAEWPVVLRKTGTNWRFIGPAFVTGIMDGEAWADGNGMVDGLSEFVLN
jgi:hypothetical protein